MCMLNTTDMKKENTKQQQLKEKRRLALYFSTVGPCSVTKTVVKPWCKCPWPYLELSRNILETALGPIPLLLQIQLLWPRNLTNIYITYTGKSYVVAPHVGGADIFLHTVAHSLEFNLIVPGCSFACAAAAIPILLEQPCWLLAQQQLGLLAAVTSLEALLIQFP